jgi:hypothetical protein
VIELNPSEGFIAATDVGLYVTLLGGLLALPGALLKPPLSVNASGDGSRVDFWAA